MVIRLRDFQVLREFEGNGVNKIYWVRSLVDGDTYVLKIVKIWDRERQIQEIEQHKKLAHKYIIKIIDYDIQVDRLMILLENAEKGDLFRYFKKLKKLDQRETLLLF